MWLLSLATATGRAAHLEAREMVVATVLATVLVLLCEVRSSSSSSRPTALALEKFLEKVTAEKGLVMFQLVASLGWVVLSNQKECGCGGWQSQ